MPNRIIKASILTSPTIDGLSAQAERHFYRLLLIADDYGCFDGNPAIIKSFCYPLKRLGLKTVENWNQELVETGMLGFWTENGRRYGVFLSWDKFNYTRAVGDDGKPTRSRRKTPEPPAKIKDMAKSRPTEGQPVAYTDTDVNTDINTDTYIEVLKTWRAVKPKAQLTEGVKKAVNARLKNYTVDEICQAIKNYAGCTDTFWVEFKAKGGWNLQQFLSRGEGEAGLGRFLTASSQYRRGLVCRWAKPPNDCATLSGWDKSGDHPCNTCERYEP